MSVLTYQKQGYLLSFTENDIDKRHEHIFCGRNEVPGAHCSNCDKPFIKFLTIDTKDRILNSDPAVKYLHLLFCWTCDIAQSDFVYQILPSNEIRVLEYGKGGAVEDFPYEDYPLFFPARSVGFKELDENLQKIILDINSEVVDILDYTVQYPDITTPQHQVGGEPLLLQSSLIDFNCPVCGEVMPLLASIGDSHPDNLSFTGNEFVQVLYFFCEKCCVIGARQICD